MNNDITPIEKTTPSIGRTIHPAKRIILSTNRTILATESITNVFGRTIPSINRAMLLIRFATFSRTIAVHSMAFGSHSISNARHSFASASLLVAFDAKLKAILTLTPMPGVFPPGAVASAGANGAAPTTHRASPAFSHAAPATDQASPAFSHAAPATDRASPASPVTAASAGGGVPLPWIE